MTVGEKRRALGTLGVRPDAEDVYRALLVAPGSSAAQLRKATGLGERRLRNALAELERKAIVTRRGGDRAGYQPAPPDIVVEALIAARASELNRARLESRELALLLRAPSEEPQVTELVEVLASRDAVAARWAQLQQATRRSLEVFTRPPLAQQAMQQHEPLQEGLRSHKVAIRALYDQDALSHPGALEHIRRTTALGEEARVVTRLPLKLAVFDRHTALLPLTHSDPASTVSSGLVIHRSALLDALVGLFEAYWHSGTPLELGEPAGIRGRGGAGERAVLALLAAGLKDEAIARELGVSAHTVRRRIAEVMARLGVSTRFQAGLALGRDGSPVAGGATSAPPGRAST